MLYIGQLSLTILFIQVLDFISDRYDMVILNVHELLPLDKGLLIVLPMPLPLILVKLVLEFLQIIKLSNQEVSKIIIDRPIELTMKFEASFEVHCMSIVYDQVSTLLEFFPYINANQKIFRSKVFDDKPKLTFNALISNASYCTARRVTSLNTTKV